MEGLGVVGGGAPRSFQVEMTVASKGCAASVFMAFSVHEYHDDEQDAAKHLTSGLALTAHLRDGQPAPAFQFGAATLRCDEKAPAVASRSLVRCCTDRPQWAATMTKSRAADFAARPRALQPSLLRCFPERSKHLIYEQARWLPFDA